MLVEAVLVLVEERREGGSPVGEGGLGGLEEAVKVAAVLVGGVGWVVSKRQAWSRLGRSDSHQVLAAGLDEHARSQALSIDFAMAEVATVEVVLFSSASLASLRVSISCSVSFTCDLQSMIQSL